MEEIKWSGLIRISVIVLGPLGNNPTKIRADEK